MTWLRGSPLPLRPIEFYVLAALAQEPLHGYGLVVAIEAMTLGRVQVRPGDLYRVLARLLDRGWIQEAPKTARDEGERPRQPYRLTAEGREIAIAQAEVAQSVAGGLLAVPDSKRPEEA